MSPVNLPDIRRQQIVQQISRQVCSLAYLIAEMKFGYKPTECGIFARDKDGEWVNLTNEKQVRIDDRR